MDMTPSMFRSMTGYLMPSLTPEFCRFPPFYLHRKEAPHDGSFFSSLIIILWLRPIGIENAFLPRLVNGKEVGIEDIHHNQHRKLRRNPIAIVEIGSRSQGNNFSKGILAWCWRVVKRTVFAPRWWASVRLDMTALV